MGQRSDNTGVIIYELPVEVYKSKEGLHILGLPRLEPVLYGLHPFWEHSKSGGQKLVSEVHGGFSVELILLGFGKEAVCIELLEDFSDMLLVGGHVSRVDEDVVQVYYDTNI